MTEGRKNTQFSANKSIFSQYLRNGGRSDQEYYDGLIGSYIMRFWLVQNQWPRMTLNGRYALCCRKIRVLEPTAKLWIKVVTVSGKNVGQWLKFLEMSGLCVHLLGIFRGGASDGSVVVDNNNFWRLFSVATWKRGMPALLYGGKQSVAGF